MKKVMDLLLKNAIEKANKDPDVERLMTEGYFLGSVFATAQDSINEWILHFYSSKKNKIVDCYVGDSVSLGEETEPMKRLTKLSVDDVKITAQEALDKAKERFNSRTINILVVLHKKEIEEEIAKKKGKATKKTPEKKEHIVWTINMIAPNMIATSYIIDAATGKLLEEKETSLITRYSRGS